jgi:hypothetical protein
MSKNNSKNQAPVIKVEATQNEVVVSTETTVSEAQLGRPIDKMSKRQQDLLERELARMQGLIKKGRPVDLTSPRQVRLQEMEERKSLGLGKPGRPKYSEAEKIEADAKKKQQKENDLAWAKAQAAKILAAQHEVVVTE